MSYCEKCNKNNKKDTKTCAWCGEKTQIKPDIKSENSKETKFKIDKKFFILILIAIFAIGYNFFGNVVVTHDIKDKSYLEQVKAEKQEIQMTYAKEYEQVLRNFAKDVNNIVNDFISYAKSVNLDNDEELDKFVKFYYDVNGSIRDEYIDKKCIKYPDIEDKNVKKICKTIKKFDEFINVEDRYIPIKNDKYDEINSNTLPIGYAVTLDNPKDGQKRMLKVKIKDKSFEKTVVTKKPINGHKIIGKAKVVEAAKKAEEELSKVIELWKNQTFTAENILSFLYEKDKEKAIEFQRKYELTIFNWIWFSGVEFDEYYTSFEKLDTYEQVYSELSDKDEYPVEIRLRIKKIGVSNINDYKHVIIRLYYNPEHDKWVITTDTIIDLLDFAKNNKLEGKFNKEIRDDDSYALTQFEYNKLNSGMYISGDSEFKISGSYSTSVKMKFGECGGSYLHSGSKLDDDIVRCVNRNKLSKFKLDEMSYSSFSNKNTTVLNDIYIDFATH